MVDHVLTDNQVKRVCFREVRCSILDLPAISTILIVPGTQSPPRALCVRGIFYLAERIVGGRYFLGWIVLPLSVVNAYILANDGLALPEDRLILGNLELQRSAGEETNGEREKKKILHEA